MNDSKFREMAVKLWNDLASARSSQDLRIIEAALRRVAAEKDAEYKGVVKAYKARLEVVESGMSKEIRSLLEAIAEAPHSVGCAKEMHPSLEASCDCWKSEAIPASLKGVAASLPAPAEKGEKCTPNHHLDPDSFDGKCCEECAPGGPAGQALSGRE